MEKSDKKKKSKVAVVMGEYKDGTLKSSSGDKVTDKKQALAIALSEAREAGEDVPENPNEKEAAYGMRDGSGRGVGRPGGARRNRNTGACALGGPGYGLGEGRGKGIGRLDEDDEEEDEDDLEGYVEDLQKDAAQGFLAGYLCKRAGLRDQVKNTAADVALWTGMSTAGKAAAKRAPAMLAAHPAGAAVLAALAGGKLQAEAIKKGADVYFDPSNEAQTSEAAWEGVRRRVDRNRALKSRVDQAVAAAGGNVSDAMRTARVKGLRNVGTRREAAKASLAEQQRLAEVEQRRKLARAGYGALAGVGSGGAGSVLYDVAKDQNINYRRALILAALTGALGGTAGYVA